MNRHIQKLIVLVLAIGFCRIAVGEERTEEAAKTENAQSVEDIRRELLSGKVVLLGAELRKRGIKASKEMDDQVVLVTDDDEMVPIVADWRGRAFYQDERLRDRKVELIVRRRPGVPYAQVLMIFTFDKKNHRQFTDYWCDICSIPMYEIMECACCQGPIRLRFQDQPLPSYITKELDRETKPARAADEPSSKK